MIEKSKKHIKISLAVIATLLLLCLVMFIWLIVDIKNLKKSGDLRVRHAPWKHAAPPQVSEIEPWMTFRYINSIYGLPAKYLATELNVPENRYPESQIGAYAKDTNQTEQAVLEQIRQAIIKFQNQ